MEIIITPLEQPTHLSAPLPAKVTFAQKKKTIFLGRESECEVTLQCQDKIISRKHAQITQQQDGYELIDLSANGTFTNNNRMPIGFGKSVKFNDSIIVNIGAFKLKIEPIAARPLLHKKIETNALSETLKTTQQPIPKRQEKPRKSLPAANISQAFIPPSVVIPEDWNAPFDTKKQAPRNNTPRKIDTLIDQGDKQLIASLLKGLGLGDPKSRQSLSNENMVAIGRCLRMAISGTLKQVEHVENIKSKLCLDEKNNLKTHNYSSFGDISTTDEFLDELFNSRRQSYSHLPLEIARCQKEVTEDYAIILNSYNKAIDSFREELSPFVIESEFLARNAKRAGIGAKLIPAIGKWQLYKALWSKKCLNFKKIIKKNFEQSIRQAHVKRINQRQINRKK